MKIVKLSQTEAKEVPLLAEIMQLVSDSDMEPKEKASLMRMIGVSSMEQVSEDDAQVSHGQLMSYTYGDDDAPTLGTTSYVSESGLGDNMDRCGAMRSLTEVEESVDHSGVGRNQWEFNG